MSSIFFEIGHSCKAFDDRAVGSKVTSPDNLSQMIVDAIKGYDFEKADVPGQAFIMLPETAAHYVTAGVGLRTDNPDDYVPRLWRGRVELFLRREHALPCEGVAAIVYTRDAYLNDPDVNPESDKCEDDGWEHQRIASMPHCTHVLVALLGFAGPKPPRSPLAFVKCLAGHNKEVEALTKEGICVMAGDVILYDSQYCVVAD